MKRNRLIGNIVKYVVLALILLFLLFPLLWVLLTSFKTNMEAYKFPPTLIPESPTVQSYIDLFTKNNEFFIYYKNNFLVAGGAALMTTLIAIMSGYALSRFHFKWNGWIVAAFTSAQMFPIISRLISLYKIMGDVHLINTRIGLVFAVGASMLPFTIMLMSSFYDGIPVELEEAAQIDGANRFQRLWKVTVPMMMPSITICIFLSITNGFKLFDQNLSLTAGEPAKMSEMMALNIFNTFYGRTGWEGVGQAKAVLFFILVVAIGMIQLRMTRSKEVQQ